MRNAPIWLTAAAVMAAAPALAADRKINENAPLDAGGSLVVSTVAGTLELRTWARNQVEVTGTVEEGVEKVEVVATGGSVRVEVKVRKLAHHAAAFLVVHAPVDCDVELQTVSSEVKVDGTLARLRLHTVSGDVKVAGKASELKVATVSGDVQVQTPARRVEIETVSGDIEVQAATAEMEAQTVSGDVKAQAQQLDRMAMTTVSGEVTVEALLGTPGPHRIATQSGDVHVVVPKVQKLNVAASTFSGSIKKDVASAKGAVDLKVTTFSGDVVVEAR